MGTSAECKRDGIRALMGTILSSLDNHLPTGPLIVLSATLWFVNSVLFAPRRGVMAKLLQRSPLSGV